jgi:hypothetical protein
LENGSESLIGFGLLYLKQTSFFKNFKGGIFMDSTTLQESVKQKAYELYLQRGGVQGNAQEDWFRAEQEVLKQIKSKVKNDPMAGIERKERKRSKVANF